MSMYVDPRPYPDWICAQCGDEYGAMPDGHIATWHEGKCGWCLQRVDVTEPRDYGYPLHPDEA